MKDFTEEYGLKNKKHWTEINSAVGVGQWQQMFDKKELERLKFPFFIKEFPMSSQTTIIETPEREVFSGEIRREGQRILKPGTNVWVQLKQVKGTKKSPGFVVECFEDNTVLVEFSDFQKRVPANEYVTGRSGTWSC